MFERLEFEFKDSWFEGTNISVYYDENEDKTYCFYTCSIDAVYNQKFKFDKKELVLDGHTLVEEIENCNFRKWYNLSAAFCDGYHFELKYNDKNKPSDECTGSNAFPDEFFELLDIFKKYIPDVKFYKVSRNKENYEIYDRQNRLLRYPRGWHDSEKTLKLLEKLTHYIDVFEGKTNFGKWKPEPNTAQYFSTENHIKYTKEVLRFIKDVIEIGDKCKDLDLYNSSDILGLLGIEEINEDVEKYYLDNRSAMLLIMHYIGSNYKVYNDYKLEEALKNGTIVRILKFIRNFNNFDLENDEQRNKIKVE